VGGGAGPSDRQYDYLIKLLLIGDSGICSPMVCGMLCSSLC